jgi:hypothetical protein
MKRSRPATLYGFCALILLIAFVSIITSRAQESVPFDKHVVFRSHLPHVSSSHGGGGGGGGKPGSGGGGTVSFLGPNYASIGTTDTPTSTGPEGEEYVAVDPVSTNTVVTAISDFSLRGGSNTTKYAVSFNATDPNGTRSWAESYVPLSGGSPATSDGRVWPYNSDPVVAIAADGTVYLADLYFHSENNDASNGLYVSVGHTSSGSSLGITQSTTYPVAVQSDPNTTIDEDKEWIAAGANGNVYVSWSRFNGNIDMIVFSRSSDHGQTWSSPIQISPTAQNGSVQGSSIAVGSNGNIYVAYLVYYVGGKRAVFLARSQDGGQSFSTAVAITPLFSEVSFNSTYRKNSFPSIAVASNNVYVVYADQGSTSSRVQFIRSTDGGNSFSSPLSLNDSSTGQRLMPSVATDEGGGLHVSWFDTRFAPAGSSSSYDIFATRSSDSGLTFSHNARVSAATINAGSASFIGDYGGVAARNGSTYPVWTSGGFNNGRLQVARLTY